MTVANLTPDLWQRLISSDEPLHPDLLPYVQETDMIGTVLKHPLVYDIPMSTPAMANWRYAKKQEALAEARANQNWHMVVWLHERPYRLTALMEIAPLADDQEYWELVGDVWIDSENIFEHTDDWIALFASERTGREHLMDAVERAALEAMDEPITIYRGFTKGVNESGLSWTISLERATWFANRFNSKGEGDVVEAWIDRADVAAHFNRRGESEIVPLDLDGPQFERYLSEDD
jgi:hypothetical protein